jgi:hypothetical protein
MEHERRPQDGGEAYQPLHQPGTAGGDTALVSENPLSPFSTGLASGSAQPMCLVEP